METRVACGRRCDVKEKRRPGAQILWVSVPFTTLIFYVISGKPPLLSPSLFLLTFSPPTRSLFQND